MNSLISAATRPRIWRFGLSSVLSFALDFTLLWLVQRETGSLLLAVVLARVVSATFNFTVNRWSVFRATDVPVARAARRYAALAAMLLVLNYDMLTTLTALGVSVLVAKIVTEGALFAGSFVTQRLIVFARRWRGTAMPAHN